MYKCYSCGKTYDADVLDDIDDYRQRVSPGDPAPAGQCPDKHCGGLCFLQQDERLITRYYIELEEGCCPVMHGPFNTEETRGQEVSKRVKQGVYKHNLFRLDLYTDGSAETVQYYDDEGDD